MTRLSDIKSLPVSEAVRRMNPELFGGPPVVAPKVKPLKYANEVAEELARKEQPPGPRYRSKWEREFHEVLKARFPNAWIEYEPMRLRLANNTTYTPDFCVAVREMNAVPCGDNTGLPALHQITFWEVKGFWRASARVKIKVAAQLYPWAKFIAVVKQKKKDGGGWKEEVFQP